MSNIYYLRSNRTTQQAKVFLGGHCVQNTNFLGGIQTNFGMEFKAHLYVPKLHGRLGGAVDAGEGVGQR